VHPPGENGAANKSPGHASQRVVDQKDELTTATQAVCGPDGYADTPVANADGKDCNVFHGDYTGLAVGADSAVNVVWTGLNRFATSPQIDAYTGQPHDGCEQDAMYARR
jgi:hypothetical protein